jgi:glutaredoxin 3
MRKKRKVEIFSAGCPICRAAIERVNQIACPSCEVVVRDMNDQGVADQAGTLGIHSVPAVVVDGRLANCCVGRGINEAVLRSEGVGQAL